MRGNPTRIEALEAVAYWARELQSRSLEVATVEKYKAARALDDALVWLHGEASLGGPSPRPPERVLLDRVALAHRAARLFHEHYERLAPEHGYATRHETRVPWDELPEALRRLTVATARAVLDDLAVGRSEE